MSQLIIDPFVVVFYLAPLNPYLILSSNYNCFITDFFLFFFSECILPGSMFWGLWSRKDNSLNYYKVVVKYHNNYSQSPQFPFTNKQQTAAQLQED